MPRIPSYRKQRSKSGDRALVEFGGVRTYLGEYNSPESRELYGRKLADWEATGGHLPAPCDDLTVNELTARYWSFAESYYVKDGEPTGELRWIKSALKPLVGLYGSLPAGEFTPLKLTAIRNQMIADGLARKPISNRIGNLKRMFKWAVVNELVSPGPAKACGRWPGPTRRKPAAVQSAGGFQACSPSCLGYEVYHGRIVSQTFKFLLQKTQPRPVAAARVCRDQQSFSPDFFSIISIKPCRWVGYVDLDCALSGYGAWGTPSRSSARVCGAVGWVRT